MIETAYGLNHAFTAPHRIATKVGSDILDNGGTAIEAMVAAAATIAVVYPHMNGIGGDGFWLIHKPGSSPISIAACGRAGSLATPTFYKNHGFNHIPARGPLAALTVPGTIDGWRLALEQSKQNFSLAELLAPAVALAKNGIAVTKNQSVTTCEKLNTLEDVHGFSNIFLSNGRVPQQGERMVQSALGNTLEAIGLYGTNFFYKGDIAETHACFLKDQGSPITLQDIQFSTALSWPYEPKNGDTIWMGATDKGGISVSFIQSVFWEFGSGLTCPDTGVFFQNRGAGFSLDPGPNQLAPGKQPFHTLNPAMALLNDGRVLSYGTMGGEGQPQTQSALYTRYAQFGSSLQQAITMPRWLLGKTWGDATTTLKFEENFDEKIIKLMRGVGHEVELVPSFSSIMGHAGAVVRHKNGMVESANDPRSDGWAYAC
ncbi:MAG: gamma-glutamyltransferase [Rhodobacteraceae bacterium]|nr:gamma-glutamyltransferase [Paracoccaceae bacterium]